MMKWIPIRLEVSVRFITRVTLVALVAAFGSLALILIAPKAIGGQSLSVLSGSMAPVVNTGDMVAIVPQKAEDIKVGEIVAFNDPNGSGRLYQHRVQYVGPSGNTIQVVTKGDANTTGEKWQTRPGDSVGKVVLIVPKVGFVLGKITGGKPLRIGGKDIPLGSVLLVIAMLIAAAIVIVGILRAPGDPKQTLHEADLDMQFSELHDSTPSAPSMVSRPIHPQQEVPPNA